jgi:hypothetical protein
MTDEPISDRAFSDLVSDMVHENKNPVDEAPEEAVNDEAPEAATEQPEEDKPEVEPEETEPEAEAADEAEAESEDVDAEPEAEAEAEEPAPTENTLPEGYRWNEDGRLVTEIVVDGNREEVDADEVRKGAMRQADYTRKTQRLAAYEKEVAAALTDQRSLVSEIQQSDMAREFVSENPDVLDHMLAAPADTRRLLGNRREFEAFIADYKLMEGNPRLAKAYLDSSTDPNAAQQVDDAREVEELRAEAENLTNFAYAIDQEVARLAKDEFGDDISEADVEATLSYLSEQIGGFNAESSPQEVLTGLRRLGTVIVNPTGTDWDMALVRDRFNALKSSRASEAKAEADAVDEHNEAVDAELAEQKQRAPSTPEGEGVAASPETGPERKSLEDVMNALRGD